MPIKETIARLVAWDHATTAKLQGWPPKIKRLMQAVTRLGGIGFGTALTLLLAFLLRKQNDVFFSNKFLAIGAIMVIFGASTKFFWRRKRPDTPYARNMLFASYSFPSGHALDSVLLYGIIACYFGRGASPVQVVLLAGGTALLVLAIAYSRVYLGAHYILDVIAGLLLGLALLLAFVFLVI